MTLADLRVGLRAYLLADAAISTLVGGTRIYPLRLPQGVIEPSVVYQRISGLGDHHMAGASGLARPRMQVSCWAQSADVATQLANLVKARIDGFRGSMLWGDNSPAEAIVVQGIFFDSERDLYDEALKLYALSRDYLIWYEES